MSETRIGAATPEWRYFRIREDREAKLHAAIGGIAVHDNEGAFPFRSYCRTAHLFAKGAAELLSAATSLGITRSQSQAWLQRDSHLHIDLFGSPLKRAVAKCVNAPKHWPRRDA